MKKYKAGIIGLGNIGYQFSKVGKSFATTHFEAFQSNPNTTLVAVCDTAPAPLAAMPKSVTPYADYKKMLAEAELDIVSICTPDETHFDILKYIAEHTAVKAVWCEKPITRSLAEGRVIVDLYQQKNIALAVNYFRRHDAFYALLKQGLAELVGEVKAVTFYYSGGLVTVGSHMCDLLSFFFGPYKSVAGVPEKNSVNGAITFANGIVAHIVPMEGVGYAIFEMNIFGTKGRVDTINKPFGEYEYRHVALEEDEGLGARWLGTRTLDSMDRSIPRDYMAAGLADIVNSLETGAQPQSSGKTALMSLEMTSALWSAAQNARVETAPFQTDILLPMPQGDIRVWKKL